MLAVNPYEWIDELYASDTATQYLGMKVMLHDRKCICVYMSICSSIPRVSHALSTGYLLQQVCTCTVLEISLTMCHRLSVPILGAESPLNQLVL